MTQAIVTRCPHCGKPFKTFESTTELIDTPLPPPPAGFWATEAGVNTAAVLLPAGITWLACWYYEQPGWIAAAVGVISGVGLPIWRAYLSRPITVIPRPDKISVDVAITDTSDRGYTLYLDSFNPDLVSWDDLVKIARAKNFSRSEAVVVGLSQDKWHKIKSEFIRLNYAVPLPNNANGYALTIRGRRLLEKIRDRQQTTTNNNGANNDAARS